MKARRLALKHAPKAIATLAALLDDEDPRVRIAAAEGLLDRAGLKPYALEPERLEVTAIPVDVDALRAALVARVEALVAGSDHLLPENAAAETFSNGGTCEPVVRSVVRSEATPHPETSPEGSKP
jgi:hypothetical protein